MAALDIASRGPGPSDGPPAAAGAGRGQKVAGRKGQVLGRERVFDIQRARMLAAAVLITLTLGATSARANLATIFATFGAGAGEVNRPDGVAVDQADGVVYIADESNNRIDEFDENGVFIRAFGFGVRTGAAEFQSCTVATTCQAGTSDVFVAKAGMIHPSALLVDPTTHNVFASDIGSYRVEEFTPAGEFVLTFGHEVDKTTHGDVCTAASGDTCGPGVIGTGPSAFSHAANYPYMPLALDPSGHLWVGDINRLQEFSTAGAFLSEVKLSGTGEIAGLAIDSTGSFYIFSGRSSIESEGASPGIHKYGASGNPLDFTSLATNVLSEPREPLALTLDAAGHLFVGDATGHLEFHESYRLLEFSAETGVELEAFGTNEVLGTPGPGKEGEAGGTIAFGDHAARIFAADTTCCASSAAQFFSLPPAGPLLRTGSLLASPVHGTTATLKAFLDPEGVETKYHFEYVDQRSFETEGGFASPHTKSTPTGILPAGFEEPEVSAALTGLTGETTYRLRLVAVNEWEAGKQCTMQSDAATFQTTPPVRLDVLYVAKWRRRRPTFDAAINTFGTDSTYRFEYVSEEAYQPISWQAETVLPARAPCRCRTGVGGKRRICRLSRGSSRVCSRARCIAIA